MSAAESELTIFMIFYLSPLIPPLPKMKDHLRVMIMVTIYLDIGRKDRISDFMLG